MRRILAVLAALALTLTCLQALPSPAAASTSPGCPPGHSFMGCALGASPSSTPTVPPGHLGATRPVAGCVFPDVSSYQGHPDWPAAAGSICAAVAKAGEGGFGDPDFAWNVAALRTLHIPWGGYWFVRGCNDGQAFVNVLSSVGFRGDRDALRPVLDIEVRSAAGCAVPIANRVHQAFGIWPEVYTAPGTWPGGSEGNLDAWEATYGPVLGPLPFTARVLAWQRYSPPFSFYGIPGLGFGDVSIDLRGFSTQLAFPPPARTVCWGPHAQLHAKACEQARPELSKLSRARDSSARALAATQANLHANRCERPYRRGVCIRLGHAAAVFAQRVHYFAGKAAALFAAYK